METGSNRKNTAPKRYFYNLDGRPSSMCRMVTFPLYMYRIRTKKFITGINFFQKAVLRFKNCPSVNEEDIVNATGFDPKLVSIVESELHNEKLLDTDGTITQNGRDVILSDDGIIIDENNTSTGYIFRPIDRQELLPTYTTHIDETDIIPQDRPNRILIVDGVKDNGEDRFEDSYDLTRNIGKAVTDFTPETSDILDAIQASVYGTHAEMDSDLTDKKEKQLSVNFLPDATPEIIFVSTYVYLPRYNDGDLYEADWTVQDPFTGKDSQYLKLYLTSIMNSDFNGFIESAFTNAKTIGNRRRTEYMSIREDNINTLFNIDFGDRMENVDQNLYIYTKSVVGAMCDLESYMYDNINASDTLISNIQKGLECIFQEDKKERELLYSPCERIPENQQWRIRCKNYAEYINKEEKSIPERLPKVHRNQPASLKSWISLFVLHLDHDPHNALIQLVSKYDKDIIKLSNKRNLREHGNISSKVKLQSMNKADVEFAYNKYKEIINYYIDIYVK